MSQRRNHSPKTKDTTCDKCGVTAHAVPGKKHRRCSGQPDAPIRAKHDALPGAQRGRWS
jgi:hypothetical protein